MTPEDLGRLWGVLRSQLAVLSVQNIRTTAGAVGFDVSQVPATSEAKSGMGSRAEVLPGLDSLFNSMTADVKALVLSALGGRLLGNDETAAQTRVLLAEQGFGVVGDRIEVDLRSDADIDHLTAVLNRRAFDADLPKELAVAGDSGEPLALLVFDVDKFKSVNDEHGGHATGDEALAAIAETSATCSRGTGVAYRLGGDEFAIILPNHTTQEAVAAAERIRRRVNENRLTSRNLKLSLSIGVAEFPVHARDVAGLKDSADRAAYDAKNLGRNLVRVFGEPPPTAPVPRPRSTGAGTTRA